MSISDEKCAMCGKPTNMMELELWNGICADCAFDDNGEKWVKILEDAKKEKVEFT